MRLAVALNWKHSAGVTVLGEAKSEPQAYYIDIVGVCFVFILSFYRFCLWKFIVPYLGRDTAGENAGLPSSSILTIYCDKLNNVNNNNKYKHAQSPMCNASAPSNQWRLTWSHVNIQSDVTVIRGRNTQCTAVETRPIMAVWFVWWRWSVVM